MTGPERARSIFESRATQLPGGAGEPQDAGGGQRVPAAVPLLAQRVSGGGAAAEPPLQDVQPPDDEPGAAGRGAHEQGAEEDHGEKLYNLMRS